MGRMNERRLAGSTQNSVNRSPFTSGQQELVRDHSHIRDADSNTSRQTIQSGFNPLHRMNKQFNQEPSNNQEELKIQKVVVSNKPVTKVPLLKNDHIKRMKNEPAVYRTNQHSPF
mmetsp:Transcript_26509/g.25638  ORF Transcript_26509/g.25638 Transcript_26509/m.25638 type:complete len:115 (+) Transcript_26509:174-518(+)